MLQKQKLQIWIYILLSVVFFGLVIAGYIHHLSKTVSGMTINTMEELSMHDLYNLNSTLNFVWNEVAALGKRHQLLATDSFESLRYRLHVQQEASKLLTLGLIDEDGNIYLDKQEVLPAANTPYMQRLLKGAKRVVELCANGEDGLSDQPSLVYAVALDPFEIEGVSFVGALGVQALKDMAGEIKLDSFSGEGYSAVIDSTGNYILLPNNNYLADSDNFFEWFAQGQFSKNLSAQEAIEKIQHGEDFLLKYSNMLGVKRVIYFRSVPDTNWSLLISIPTTVLSHRTQHFVLIAMLMLGGNLLLFMLLVFFIFRMRLKTVDVKAEARAKEDFLSRMSHEIRTPLNGIIGLNHLMALHVSDRAKIEEYIKKSSSTARYLLSLVNDVLDMSKLSQDQMHMERKPFTLELTVAALDSIMRSRMETKDIDFQIHTQFSHPVIVGDETRLEQVLMNILGNAAKFTPEGGRISLDVSQDGVTDGQIVTRFVIEDTGCGMTEEFQKHMFEMFQQERNEVTKGNEGTGLGMPISRLLMEKMGGTIAVESKLGKGSRFTVVLPAPIADVPQTQAATAQMQSLATGGTAAAASPKQPLHNTLHILVAEDNELNAEILTEILELEGYRVSVAENGKRAVELFEASTPGEFGLILMDVQMPILNGLEATRKIRSLQRSDAATVRIIACTANTFKKDQDEALASGMNDFIGKPIDVKKLMKMIKA